MYVYTIQFTKYSIYLMTTIHNWSDHVLSAHLKTLSIIHLFFFHATIFYHCLHIMFESSFVVICECYIICYDSSLYLKEQSHWSSVNVFNWFTFTSQLHNYN